MGESKSLFDLNWSAAPKQNNNNNINYFISALYIVAF